MVQTRTILGLVALQAGLAYAALDPDLKRSFWGISYSSTGVIPPNCYGTPLRVAIRCV
jgi:hypothetical protein